MRLKLISCEVLYREMCAAAAHSPHQVDVEFLPKGLHDQSGPAMRARLQEAADRVDATRYEAVLLGYALCGNGVAGLVSRTLPVVIPRAHDCIALLMGGRDRYRSYFENHPGVFFRSTGWLERGQDLDQAALLSLSRATAKTTAATCSSSSMDTSGTTGNWHTSPLGWSRTAVLSGRRAKKPLAVDGSSKPSMAICACSSGWWPATGTKTIFSWCRPAGA